MGKHRCVTLVPLFNHLGEADLAKIDQLVAHRTYQKGEQVILPDQDPQLTIVARGQLKMYQLSASGKEQLLRVVEPGGYEGENALFGAANENLFGEALAETTVCFLRHQDFSQLLLQYPQLSLKLLEINAKKAAATEHQAQFLVMEAVENRLAAYLLDLAKATNSETFTLPMKMKELAAFIGTTPETISRKFKNFEAAGWLKRQGREIQLLDLEALEDF